MRYSMKQIKDEIRVQIDHMIERNNSEIQPDWITQSIINAHPAVVGEDADFYLCCSRSMLQHEVRQMINQLDKANPPGSQQIVMEGFNHLQKYYVIQRDKERRAVRIDLMSKTELEAKLREHEARAETEAEHAREIRRYIELRFGVEAA